MLSADFDKILGVLFGNEHCFDAPAQGREQLLLESAIGNTRPRNVISPVMPRSERTGAGQQRDKRRGHGDTGRRSILRGRAFRDVHMNVGVVKECRLNPKVTARERT